MTELPLTRERRVVETAAVTGGTIAAPGGRRREVLAQLGEANLGTRAVRFGPRPAPPSRKLVLGHRPESERHRRRPSRATI